LNYYWSIIIFITTDIKLCAHGNQFVTHPDSLPSQRLLPSASHRVADANSEQEDQQAFAQNERQQDTLPAIVALQQT
jgi:hypothetical protein